MGFGGTEKAMSKPVLILDHIAGISFDPQNPPFRNYHAFKQNLAGLKLLADSVRDAEISLIEEFPFARKSLFWMGGPLPPVVPCAFNWFAVTLVNHLRLVALVDLMTKRNWTSSALTDPNNRREIKEHCTNYVKQVSPELYVWRNKVAAHFAATDPFSDDTIGTLKLSVMNTISYKYPRFYAGLFQLGTGDRASNLPTWSLTETYEALSYRLWPDVKLREPEGGFE